MGPPIVTVMLYLVDIRGIAAILNCAISVVYQNPLLGQSLRCR